MISPLPLSVAIVCKNSERTIERTLASVAGLAAEIICLDSGSTDATLEICRRHGARCEHQDWLGHIRQKQLAMDRCAQPWILSLDGDESLGPNLREAISEALRRDDAEISGYWLNRKVFYRGAFLNYAWQPEYRLRLVRRGAATWGGVDPHDRLIMNDPAAGTGKLPGVLRHDSFHNMEEYLRKQIELSRAGAEAYRRLGKRTSPLRLVVSPCSAWCRQMIFKSAWRDGWRGFIAASATAAAAVMKHLILLEQSRASDKDEQA